MAMCAERLGKFNIALVFEQNNFSKENIGYMENLIDKSLDSNDDLGNEYYQFIYHPAILDCLMAKCAEKGSKSLKKVVEMRNSIKNKFRLSPEGDFSSPAIIQCRFWKTMYLYLQN